LLSVTRPAGESYVYGHDGLHRLTSVTPPSPSAPQSITNDGLGRMTQRKLGAVATWIQTWAGGAGTLATPAGDVLVSTYDGRGRLVHQQSTPNAGSVSEASVRTWAYDGLDSLVATREVRAGGTVAGTYGYDARHLLTSVTRDGQPAVAFGVDDDGQRTSVSFDGALQLQYGYDALRRLNSVTGSWGSTSVGWQPGGQVLASTSDATGAGQGWVYDSRGLVRSTAGVSYDYDALDNPTFDSRRGTGQAFFYADADKDRLTGVVDSDGLHTYTLKPDGRRDTEALPDGRVLTYSYEATLGALTSVLDGTGAGTVVVVDSAGRVTSVTTPQGVQAFTWSPDDRLVSANGVTFTYDGQGLRRSASDGRRWLYAGEELLGESLAAPPVGGYQPVWGLQGLTLAQGGTRYAVDSLGSPVSDSAGRSTAFSAWGVSTAAYVPGTPSLGFTGYRVESPGLLYAQQRWYLPGVGAFASLDSVGPAAFLQSPNGLSPWSYANGSPGRYVDRDGRCWAAPGTGSADCVDLAVILAQPAVSYLVGVHAEIGKNTREFWFETPARRQVIGVYFGVGTGFIGIDLPNALPQDARATGEMVRFSVSAANAVMTLGESVNSLRNLRPPSGPPALAVAGGATLAAPSLSSSAPNLAASAVYMTKALEVLSSYEKQQLEDNEGCVEETPSTGREPPPEFLVPWQASPALGSGSYSEFFYKKEGAEFGASLLVEGFQANHLNQNAAFRAVIPRDQGIATGLQGDALRQPGTPHYEFHRSLEEFWEPFRKSNKVPTNAQYGQAVERALTAAGVAPKEVKRLSALAAEQRAAFGLKPSTNVPRVPCRFGPKRK
jgi:RHS repeat-associated protein